MLRATGQWLFAAKTSVKEPVKQKATKAAREKKGSRLKVVDKSQWHHSRYNGNRLNDIVEALPKAPKGTAFSSLLHKNGYGLKFYREEWSRYPEPCYWTIVKYKPKLAKEKDAVAWGIRTWRGRTEPLPRMIPSSHKKEWRILLEPGTVLGPSVSQSWTAPPIRSGALPAASTQLPDDLPGAEASKWPYPWGTLGSHNVPATNPRTPTPQEQAQSDAEKQEDDEWNAARKAERAQFLATFGIGVEAEAAEGAEGDSADADAAAADADADAATSAPSTIDAEAKRVDTEPAAPGQ